MKKILTIFLLFTFFLTNINFTKADLYVDFNTCKLNNAFCNVKNPEIPKAKKDYIDKILSQFYYKMSKKYQSYTDLRYLYYTLLTRIKEIVSRANTYDDKYKIIYYLYYNVESEYYKVNHALVLENQRRLEEQQKEISSKLNELEWNDNTINKSNNNISDSKTIHKTNIKPEKNTFNDSFSKAKRILERYVYWKELPRKTIYCGCDFDSKKYVDNSACGYFNDGRYKTRSKKIEWEHVVPAENFGQSFKEWREWDPACVDSKGRKFKWRKCAEKVNKEYRYIQADMYNLYPAVWALNALRSNYNIAEIQGEKREFWKCDFEIDNRKMEPPTNMKGDIARVYMYMDKTYPGKWILSNKNKKLVEVWNKIDPISEEECKRYHAIKKYQKNINIILEEPCKLVK